MTSPTNVDQLCHFMEQLAPKRLAEDWDNVGLLLGDRAAPVQRVMTCLTITPESATEAIERQADLIVTHHPLPFHPIRKLTTDEVPSRMLWQLARAGIGIYCPHTGFDSAAGGINESLATRLGVARVHPLNPIPDDPQSLGSGRMGELSQPTTLRQLIDQVKTTFERNVVKYVGQLDDSIHRVAFACGSGGSFLSRAIEADSDVLITGEASFHTCLEAKANDVALILLGHFTSERFAVEQLAHQIENNFGELTVWASERETDPVHFVSFTNQRH